VNFEVNNSNARSIIVNRFSKLNRQEVDEICRLIKTGIFANFGELEKLSLSIQKAAENHSCPYEHYELDTFGIFISVIEKFFRKYSNTSEIYALLDCMSDIKEGWLYDRKSLFTNEYFLRDMRAIKMLHELIRQCPNHTRISNSFRSIEYQRIENYIHQLSDHFEAVRVNEERKKLSNRLNEISQVKK
jgi:hypothetical protein